MFTPFARIFKPISVKFQHVKVESAKIQTFAKCLSLHRHNDSKRNSVTVNVLGCQGNKVKHVSTRLNMSDKLS